MNAQTKVEAATLAKPTLAKLREPFPANQISKLPKPTKQQTEAVKADYKKGTRCKLCQAWHHPEAIHLDYVGHAALTDRLLDTDPEWSWEPFALDERGLPAFDQNGGLWIKLTVLGMTRPGYGHAAAKANSDPGAREKECIGDALRNAAMRFGAALDLWHKGDLHLEDDTATGTGGQGQNGEVGPPEPAKRGPQHSALKTRLRGFVHEMNGCGDGDELSAFLATPDAINIIAATRKDLPHLWDGEDWPEGIERPEEFVPLADQITKRQNECAQATADYMSAG